MNKEQVLLLDHQLCFPLYAASRLTTKLYAPLLKELDITYLQFLVLLVLWEKDHCSVSEISQLLYLESNTLTPLLKRMEKKELITRNRSSKDERSVIISLTAKGTQLKEQAVCIPEKIVNALSGSSMTEKEVLSFKSTLTKMLKVLEGER